MPRVEDSDSGYQETISIDCETQGTDFFHGAKPFFVTICKSDGTQSFWEWDVDPLTREVIVPKDEIASITSLIGLSKYRLVGQHIKFDVKALHTVASYLVWPWHRTEDTLVASHLLASNQPHDLTSLALHYLGMDLKPFEDVLEKATKKARGMVQRARLKLKRRERVEVKVSNNGDGEGNIKKRKSKKDPDDDPIPPYHNWAIAEENREGMPSAGKEPWRYDYWLPRAMAKELGYPKPNLECNHLWDLDFVCERCNGHQWWIVLSDYSNADSFSTIKLWEVLEREIKGRGLWKIYKAVIQLPKVLYGMEDRGVTFNLSRMKELLVQYENEVEGARELCESIASGYGYDLVMPKGPVNNSLRTFCFDVMNLPPIINRKAKTANPAMNKDAMTFYLQTYPERSREGLFVRGLSKKSSRGTAVNYLKSYRRFALPVKRVRGMGQCCICGASVHPPQVVGLPCDECSDWMILHPNINQTATDTLRKSSTNPNAQNIQGQDIQCEKCEGDGCNRCKFTGESFRSLRYCFGPAPGREWWVFDAKNIELRIPAYESGEEDFIALFERPDDPPYFGSNHLMIAHILFQEGFEKCVDANGILDGRIFKKKYPTLYKKTKNGNFAHQYGAVDRPDGKGTADLTYGVPGAQSRIKSKFAKQESLNQHWVRFAEKNGYVETIPDKKVDPLHGYPLMCMRTTWGNIKPTLPLNYHVQATAMWWMGRAEVKVDGFFERLNSGESFQGRKWPGGYYISLEVHDELDIDAPSGRLFTSKGEVWEYNLPVMREVQRLMASCGDGLGIPTPVSMEICETTWAEGRPV